MSLKYSEHEGGGQTSGGGGGVFCKKGGKKTLVTLDYYEASLSQKSGFTIDEYDNPNHEDQYGSTYKVESAAEEALDDVISALSGTPELRENLLQYLEKVGNVDNWVPASLEEYNDHNKAYKIAEKGCRYVQIAVRQGDVVYKDNKMVALLPASQRALIRVHEALYYAAKDKVNLADSSYVRQLITQMLNKMAKFYYFDNQADFKNLNLCAAAEKLGLCRVFIPDSASRMEKAKYDLIFHPYFDDLIKDLSRNISDMNDKVSKEVFSTYPDLSSAKAAFDEFSNLTTNINEKYYTLPLMFTKISELETKYRDFGCSPKVDNDRKIYKPDLTRDQIAYCKSTARILENTVLMIDEGFTRYFCVGSDCSLKLDVYGLDGWMRPRHAQTDRSDWYSNMISIWFSMHTDLENYEALEKETTRP